MQQQHDILQLIVRLAQVCKGSASNWSQLEACQDLLLCTLPESLSVQSLSAAYDVALELLVGRFGGFFGL